MPRISASAKKVVRRNLVETAALHFSRSGFAASAVDAISFDAGYAKGTLYNYFRSKEELFEAVIREGVKRAKVFHDEACTDGSVRDRLLALARADVEMVRDNEYFAQVLVRETMSFHPLAYPLVTKHRKPYIDLIRTILDDGVTTGEIRADRPIEEQALLYAGNLSLLYVQYWGTGGEELDLDDIPEMAVDSFLKGAEPRSSGREIDCDYTSQLSLFPLFVDDDSLLTETTRGLAHDADGQAEASQTLH